MNDKRIMLKLCKIQACPNGTLGIHLSRAPYDPYPWVSGVVESSSAFQSGIRIGDTVLECNGSDVLGWKISELAIKIRNHWDCGGKTVNFLIWRNRTDSNLSSAAINQQSLQKFATCLQNIAQLLECPICLEVIKPPGWQCCNGHVLCNSCRNRSVKCPICRVPLGPRGRCLLSDKLFTLLAESFPCDRTRNENNINGPCPQDNQKSRKTNQTKTSGALAIQSSIPVAQTLNVFENSSTISNNENENDQTTRTTTITTSTNETENETMLLSRVITVGEETRTSPIKIRNNRISSNLKILTTLPNSSETPIINTSISSLPATTTVSTIPDTVQHSSILTKRIISVAPSSPTIETASAVTTIEPTRETAEFIAPLIQPTILISATNNTIPVTTMTTHIPCMSSTTVLNPNSLISTCEEKLLQQQQQQQQQPKITLKVKSKSSEDLDSLAIRSINTYVDIKVEHEQATSLPATPVSNLVNTKKNSKVSTKMNALGVDILVPSKSQRSNKSSMKTTTKSLAIKEVKTQTISCPSNCLWPNLIQEYKNYNCPTGKSSCIIKEIDEILPTSSSLILNNFHYPTTQTTFNSSSILENNENCCNYFKCENKFSKIDKNKVTKVQQDQLENDEQQILNSCCTCFNQKNCCTNVIRSNGGKINSNESDKNFDYKMMKKSFYTCHQCSQPPHFHNVIDSDFIQQKDIKLEVHSRLLNHLREQHQISLLQYHCDYDEKIPINLNTRHNNESNILMCISIENDVANYVGIKKFDDATKKQTYSFNNKTKLQVTESLDSSTKLSPFKTMTPLTSTSSSHIILPSINDCIKCSFHCSCCTQKDNNPTSQISSKNLLQNSDSLSAHNTHSKNDQCRIQLPMLKRLETKAKLFTKFNNSEGIKSTSLRQILQLKREKYTKSFEESPLGNKTKQEIPLNTQHYQQVYPIKYINSDNLSVLGQNYKNPSNTTSRSNTFNYQCSEFNTKFNELNCQTTTTTSMQTQLNCNKISKSFKYKISVQSCPTQQQVNNKKELFFIIKIPLKDYINEFCCCCCCCCCSSNSKNKKTQYFPSEKFNNKGSNENNSANKILAQNNFKINSTHINSTNVMQQQNQQQQQEVHVRESKINPTNNFINSFPIYTNTFHHNIFESAPLSLPTTSASSSLSSIESTAVNKLNCNTKISHHNQSFQQTPQYQEQNHKCHQYNYYQNRAEFSHSTSIKHINNNCNYSCCNTAVIEEQNVNVEPSNIKLLDNINKTETCSCYMKNSSSTTTVPIENIELRPAFQSTSATKTRTTKENFATTTTTTTNKQNFAPDVKTSSNSYYCYECCNSCSNENQNQKFCNFQNKSAIFIWYCGSNDELNMKNFRAVIEYCKIIKKRDKNENNNQYNSQQQQQYNCTIINDDNNDYSTDAIRNVKSQELFWNLNKNGIKFIKNENLNNDSNKCIHEFNTVDVDDNKTNNNTNDDDDDDVPINDDENTKISLWIHPMTKSWNCIRNTKEFHIMDDEEC